MTAASNHKAGTDMNKAEHRLLESALSLFAEKGYEGTSIREIIERAGVTRPVLYYYFKSKEALFIRLVETSFMDFVEYIERVTASTTGCRDRLLAVMRMAFNHAEQSPEMVRLVLQVIFLSREGDGWVRGLVKKRFGRLDDIMRGGIESGEIAGGDPELLSIIFAGIMDMHVMAKAHMPQGQLSDALADGLVDLFFFGANHEAGVRRLAKSPFSH
jgi:AcrR family transcriptional regulator